MRVTNYVVHAVRLGADGKPVAVDLVVLNVDDVTKAVTVGRTRNSDEATPDRTRVY